MFNITIAICRDCGEEMSIPGLIDRNIQEFDKQYRDYENIVSINDIENLMEKKGVEALTGRGSVPDMSRPRRFEIAGCINRFVK